MELNQIVLQLKEVGILQGNDTVCEPLSGGTSSQVYMISKGGNRYAVKMNDKAIIEAESKFLSFYQDVPYLPKVVYIDPSYNFFVYHFMKGCTNSTAYDKEATLIKLTEQLVNHYKPSAKKQSWGWVHYEVSSWHTYLQDEVESAVQILNNALISKEDIHFVKRILANLKSKNDLKRAYFLHGDCGFHNFLFSEKQLVGVIDPSPLIGDPMYDVIFAYCSSPIELSKELIESVANHVSTWDGDNTTLHQYVLIGLIVRMSSCKRHHPQDLEAYLQAWDYWKQIVEKGLNSR
ncbi:aminoglycoside phosphotransferase family protein [Bacillus sp. JJ722]|uniref:aminoglycoside phosphotransferase family protein n=1 Tax=Bacillus sp. JJ722 TaxID=3122973 RepID=UPI002FFF3F93